jgi:hypothetical protein
MSPRHLDTDKPVALHELLGYLNYSSGSSDPQFLRGLNELFASIEASGTPKQGPLAAVRDVLVARLAELAGQSPAFADVEQARAVLSLALDEFPPRYREFHRDLLFHQSDEALWRPFFLGRVFEAILEQGSPWDETGRVLEGAMSKLNDYIGHRPVAVLRTAQRIEPYPHEWIRPVPLYVRGAGVGVGPYHEVVQIALEILRATDPAILSEAHFDCDLLDELAFDPRAYDFDHPVNKRPNYHFGQWDPHHIDNQGRYRRFVVQQVTLDVLLERMAQTPDLPSEELLVEAAAVLAGIILMASGTSGSGPDALDSTTTLGTLLPKIAGYRDRFYDQFVNARPDPHGERLRAEAIAGKQPLAGARQHLNQQLARRRASQLEHVHLALLFARMGYADAAIEHAQVVPVAAARMACEIQCRMTTANLALDAGQLDEASRVLVEIENYLHRAIECGALVDPWNILGFQGQFSLFPSPENSVPDHRLDQLIAVMEQIVSLYARLWSESAARDHAVLTADLDKRMTRLTTWWDRFAPTTVESIEAFSGGEALDSAREVAGALAAFRQAGAAAGDIVFWHKRVAHFNSPKAYALVVDALEQRPDLVAARALLMQWLSQAGSIALRQGEYSFHALAERWLDAVARGSGDQGTTIDVKDRAIMIRKFFELLEANAEDYWQVPTLDLLGTAFQQPANHEADLDETADDQDDEERSLYSAAYDDMVYIDSTGDGVEADMLEGGAAPATDFELEQEARRVGERLAFLRTVATLWKKAVLACGPLSASPMPAETLERWLEQAMDNERRLLELLRAVSERRVPPPSSSRESLLEFDRRRGVKEALVEKITATVIDTGDAARAIRAASPLAEGSSDESAPIDDVMRAVVRGERARVEQLWPRLLDSLRSQPLLYVPLSKGGEPARLIQARALGQTLRDLLEWLPRLGLLAQTCQLIEAARLMESANPVGPGAISEFDRLFAAGYESIVESLVTVSTDWGGSNDEPDNDLVECLEQLTESLLKQWLAHSRTLRLSTLERISDDKSWKALVEFIQRYGADLFTQRFLNLGNLRAILHQGVDAWLTQLEEQPDDDERPAMINDLGEKLARADAVKHLTLVIEAIVENYAEYRDYNSTTTQSDRGDLLYTLLDFLRLRVHYDRVAWHLKPVMAAHAILVRRGRTAAAEMWRRAVAERTGELADTLAKRCAELRKKYAMRLPTVTDRIAERFVRPLTIDRVCALIKPAMHEVRRASGPSTAHHDAFELLKQETNELTQEPTGVGLDVPAWLVSLEQEVDAQHRAGIRSAGDQERQPPLAQTQLTLEQVQNQLTGWELHPH